MVGARHQSIRIPKCSALFASKARIFRMGNTYASSREKPIFSRNEETSASPLRADFRPSATPIRKCQIGTIWPLKYLLGVGCREVWAVGLVLLGVGCRAQFCGKNHDMYARDPLPLKKHCVSLVFLLGVGCRPQFGGKTTK